MRQPDRQTPQQLAWLMERAIRLVNDKIPADKMRELASAFRTLRWDFSDCDLSVYLVVEDSFIHYALSVDGPPDMTIRADSATLHDVALGQTSFGSAFIMGKLGVKGLSPLKLGKFLPLLDPFLESYRQAWEEINGTG